MKRYIIALLILGAGAYYIGNNAVSQVRAAQYTHASVLDESTK